MNYLNYQQPKIIAEIGCNHLGNLDVAKELIRLAKECKADYAKFQKRNPKELLTKEQYGAPHPVPYQSYGATYGEHREVLEFNIDQHIELKKYAEYLGIGYACSVWDTTSAEEIISLKPDFIKVPAASNCNFEMLVLLRDHYSADIHLSVGMTTWEEIETIIQLFEETNQAKSRLILYSCTSGYPIDFRDVCLLELRKLYFHFKSRIKEFGFSGHHLGIAIDVAAYTLGAKWIERHFTKDRTWKGTDHAASLEVTGLQKLARDLHHTYEALNFKSADILTIEKIQRDKLKSHTH
ncbi:N-acetylneuraminate synthase family protein [Dyadobacter frigoris]|uniref:N-acetylneuraminate synthase n=1 Tax=Dyadobacter frigoris TaxID=2576211 RepID=A0A4U6DHF2_9BACT|nr:N-acetylneuraminate synthase family protein [Dyadobacter frigoris]TKT94134.1 N-acetylneuraminate synthase [Dyadobacter frigoris]GLU50654.1 N-acetylneuraminate synthase [Dyadobacter frigoris]